ncbi:MULTISPECIES: stage II sporulation protein M [unclassified Bacillus cereus group]|uniref:stage II sporulation protein M n=1 Tax=unclassified Bacillus cereus group TaxID=2750818 RepID=UPI003390AC23
MELFNIKKLNSRWFVKNTIYKLFSLSLILYIISFFIGFSLSESIGIKIDKQIAVPHSFLYYIDHNLKSAMYLGSGILSFSLTTIWYLFINGCFLGVTFAGISSIHSYGFALGSILTHGVFEIPAINLIGAVGLYPLYFIYSILKNKKVLFIVHIKNIISMIIFSLFLFVIAGILEAYISPMIIEWMNK